MPHFEGDYYFQKFDRTIDIMELLKGMAWSDVRITTSPYIEQSSFDWVESVEIPEAISYWKILGVILPVE